MADEFSAREQALRQLPLPYSLALRLRDAGVAREVICEYVDLEEASLDDFYRVAEAKLLAVQQGSNDAHRGARRTTSSHEPKPEFSNTQVFPQRMGNDPTVGMLVDTSSATGRSSGRDDDDD